MEEQISIPSAIYLRVSPTTHIKTASDLHASLLESLNVCMRDIKNEGNEAVAIYIDEYVSGKSSKHMKEFQHMMEDARLGQNTTLASSLTRIGNPVLKPWKRIYARRVNRFGRNRGDMIAAELELTKLGYTLKFSEQGLDTDKPYGKSIMGFMAEQAEADRLDIRDNTKRGREDYVKKGGKFGRPEKKVPVDYVVHERRKKPFLDGKRVRKTWKELSIELNVSVPSLIEAIRKVNLWDEENGTVKQISINS